MGWMGGVCVCVSLGLVGGGVRVGIPKRKWVAPGWVGVLGVAVAPGWVPPGGGGCLQEGGWWWCPWGWVGILGVGVPTGVDRCPWGCGCP